MIKQSQKGFGLLEVIITMSVIAIGLVGILILANTALKGASLSRMRLIASGLAQEGIEVVRDVRRANLEWTDWHSTISESPIDYRFQYNSQCLTCCPDTPGTCPGSDVPLKLDSNSGLYQYSSGNETPFYRKITLEKISPAEVKIVVEVKWQLKGQEHSLIAEDRLWNWK